FRKHLLLSRRSGVLVMMNRYPYNGGHLMVAPAGHIGEISTLTDAECGAMTRAVRACVKVLRDTMNPAGFNIGMNIGKVAGAGVEDHLHVHIVPRWLGDTNFMPVLAGTSTVPEALDELYDRLKPAFDAVAGEI
ncbi:MAG: HIT domain-containing protein, partial [Planctomycetota bacterium]|nr:HIT domain-containing protein [Planctomycetota bacterium]